MSEKISLDSSDINQLFEYAKQTRTKYHRSCLFNDIFGNLKEISKYKTRYCCHNDNQSYINNGFLRPHNTLNYQHIR